MNTLVFDFDGTLTVPNVELMVDILNDAARKKFTSTEMMEFKNLSARAFMKKVGVHWWQLPFILRRGKKILERKTDQMRLVHGMKWTLQQLKKQYTLGILTSHPHRGVTRFLEQNGVSSLFDFVIGDVAPFRKHRKLKALRRIYNFVYVGDEVRDVEASRRAHLPIAAVTWGYNSMDALKRAGPTYIITKPKGLMKLATSSQQKLS